MRYTLVTSTGRVMKFYILGVAETYQSIYGGILYDSEKPHWWRNSSIYQVFLPC